MFSPAIECRHLSDLYIFTLLEQYKIKCYEIGNVWFKYLQYRSTVCDRPWRFDLNNNRNVMFECVAVFHCVLFIFTLSVFNSDSSFTLIRLKWNDCLFYEFYTFWWLPAPPANIDNIHLCCLNSINGAIRDFANLSATTALYVYYSLRAQIFMLPLFSLALWLNAIARLYPHEMFTNVSERCCDCLSLNYLCSVVVHQSHCSSYPTHLFMK